MSTTKPENPLAFPLFVPETPQTSYQEIYGMRLRDYFAAQVIGPLMSSNGFEQQILRCNSEIELDELPQFAAEQAYDIAEAMLAEREKRK